MADPLKLTSNASPATLVLFPELIILTTSPPEAKAVDDELTFNPEPVVNTSAEIATASPVVNASAVKLAAPAAELVVAVVDTLNVGAA